MRKRPDGRGELAADGGSEECTTLAADGEPALTRQRRSRGASGRDLELYHQALLQIML